MSLGPRAIILWQQLVAFWLAHWPVILDVAAAGAAWVFGFSTIGFYPWVPAVPAVYLLARIFWLRTRLASFTAPGISPK